jgi:hypothetical protein
MGQNLNEKAMLVKLNIRQWTARRNIPEVAEEVSRDKDAAPGTTTVSKYIVAREAIKRVNTAANSMRTYHAQQTLPWLDNGARILPCRNFETYSSHMRKLQEDFESAVREFVWSYPDLQNQAQMTLGRLYDPDDYPTSDKIERRFHCEVNIDPIPDSNDFRAHLQETDIKRIQERLAARQKREEAEAMEDLWGRLYKAIEHIVERLSDKDKVFRQSLIGNVCELIDILPRLNISDDPKLSAMAQTVKSQLCLFEPEEIRKDQAVRAKVAKDAKGILDAMAGYMGKPANEGR